MNNNRICAILLAGGSGTRMKLSTTKQRLIIKGKSVLFRAVSSFESCPEISDVILVVREDELDFAKEELNSGFTKLRKIVIGGKTRLQSAVNGFSAIDFYTDLIAIHDVARCLISPKMITKVVLDAEKYGAASACYSVVDTVKTVDDRGFVVSTEKRDKIRMATTPQIFKTELYESAVKDIDLCDESITDDNMLMERIGVPVFMTDIGKENIKITHAEDISYAEYLLGESYV